MRVTIKNLLAVIVALIGLPCFAQKDFSIKYADIITPQDLKAKLSIIASAEMQGRRTTTPGQKKAAAYIENNFKRFGLLPGTNAGYQMPFAVYRDSLWAVSLIINDTGFVYAQNFNFSSGSAPNGNFIFKEITFIGKGDSSTISSMDLTDKWVLVEVGDRNRTALNILKEALKAKKTKGYINVSRRFPSPAALLGGMYIKTNPAVSNNLLSFNVSYKVASALLNKPIASSADLLNIAPGTYGANVYLQVIKRTMLFQSTNVVGVLPGTDKRDEYVFLTAHYDHIGMQGNVINYGADDDGSGTTAVLQMAEAFARARAEGHGPRRSIVFMTVSGEEEGLLGSQFYSEHPLFPFNKTSVDLNTDMIGRIDTGRKEDSTNYVYTIGENKLSSDLVRITDSVRNKYSTLVIDRRFNINDPASYYTRSDHYNFAKKGVPIIFYFNGTHADYHKPTDTVDKINFDLMTKRVKFIFHTAWIMANRDGMLNRDLPL